MNWAWSEYQQSNIDEFFAVSYEELLLAVHGGKVLPPDGSGLWQEVEGWFADLGRSA